MKQNGPSSAIVDLAKRLIASETPLVSDDNEDAVPLVRVCEKMRLPLSMLAGSLGFRTLLTRALTVARAECNALSAISVKSDGTLSGFEQIPPQDSLKASVALTSQLFHLLVTFVGESLTLQLIHEQWPDLHLSAPEESQSHERSE